MLTIFDKCSPFSFQSSTFTTHTDTNLYKVGLLYSIEVVGHSFSVANEVGSCVIMYGLVLISRQLSIII